VVTAFIGREGEQEQLRQLLATAPVVTVTGPAGVGKTRLALEALRDPLDGVPGRVVVCELASLRAGADAEAVAAEVGYESADAAAASLAEAPAVLVLDNCEHVLAGVSLFVSRLLPRSAASKVVATSREPLGVAGEHVMVLGPLEVPAGVVDVEDCAAVQLFLDRAQAAGAGWPRTPDVVAAVAELCRWLDGLPLAIELAAARSRALSPGELLALMDRRLDLLAARGPAVADRHRSLRAALDVSVDLLDEEERATFENLGILSAPFDVALAHQVAAPAGADRLRTIDLLAALVDRSLMIADQRHGATRYRLLEVIRDRALEGLVRRGGVEPIADRFVDAMVAEADRTIAEGLSEWSGDLVRRVVDGFHHLTEAIEWCLFHDADPERTNRLVLPLFVVVHRSRSREILALGRRVLAQWPDQRAPWQGEMLAVLASAAVMSGDPSTAIELGERALADPEATSAARLVAHRALALSARSAGDLGAALAHASAGRQAAGDLGAASFERDLASLEAATLDLNGDSATAADHIDWVVEQSAGAGDVITEVGARLARATLAMRADRWDEAREDVKAATTISGSLTQPWWEGAVERCEAILVTHDHGWPGSAGAWQRAIDATAARGAAGEMALTLRLAASVAAHAGHEDDARRLLDAVPATPEVAVLPDLYPDDLRRLESAQPTEAARPSIVRALEQSRQVFSGARAVVPPPVTAASGSVATAVLRRDGDHWTVSYGGRTVSVRHLKGLLDLAALVAAPASDVHCLQLMGGVDVGGEPGEIIDDQARRAYQARIAELQADIDEAHAGGNSVVAERVEQELDALVTQLAEAFGLGGRRRSTGGTTERARSAVTYRLRAAIRRIADVHPDLGRHLENAVRTGTWCTYRPESDVRWDVDLGASQAAQR